MTTRRYAITPTKSPQLTGGDDRPEPACLGKSEPYDVLIEGTGGLRFDVALREARRICGGCDIQLDCLRANREEEWVKALVGANRPGPRPHLNRECVTCGIPMVGSGRRDRPEGFSEHVGRGLCLACYSEERRRRRKSVA